MSLQQKIATIDKKIEAAKFRLTTLQVDKAQLEEKILVQCTDNLPGGKGCGQEFQIGTLTYIQPYWYESPWGCTGGDTWHKDERDGYFICPACNHKNRLYNRPQYLALSSRFKNVEVVHEK